MSLRPLLWTMHVALAALALGCGGQVDETGTVDSSLTAPEMSAFQANTGALWVSGGHGGTSLKLGMRPGTSPSIATLSNGSHEIAFQANTGSLWTVGGAGNRNWGLGMKADTSPSITALPGGGYEVAFQANTGSLWTVGTGGNKDWKLPMRAGTSPSIAAVNGGYEVAFQANSSDLWTAGVTGNRNWHLGMMAGTSPSITALSDGKYEVAFQANTTALWTVDAGGPRRWELGLDRTSSPSITGLPNGGFSVAFQANTHSLWTAGTTGIQDWKLGMKAGTSPSISAGSGGAVQVVFQANTGDLWTMGRGGTEGLHLGMRGGTSPAASSPLQRPMGSPTPTATPGGGRGRALDVPASLVSELSSTPYVEESCSSTTFPNWPYEAKRCTYGGGYTVTVADPAPERVARWIVEASTRIPALDSLRTRDRAHWEEGLRVIALRTMTQSSRIFPLDGTVLEDQPYTFHDGVTSTCSTGCYCRINSLSRNTWCAYDAAVHGANEQACLDGYGQTGGYLAASWETRCFENHKASWNLDANEDYRADAYVANRDFVAPSVGNPATADGAAVVAALRSAYP